MWNRVKAELDRAGRVAHVAFDESRIRLDLFRARQTADRSAQRLGYAIHSARKAGGDLTTEQYAPLAADLAAAEAEVARYETLLAEAGNKRRQITAGD
jgi:hypothetical protein